MRFRGYEIDMTHSSYNGQHYVTIKGITRKGEPMELTAEQLERLGNQLVAVLDSQDRLYNTLSLAGYIKTAEYIKAKYAL